MSTYSVSKPADGTNCASFVVLCFRLRGRVGIHMLPGTRDRLVMIRNTHSPSTNLAAVSRCRGGIERKSRRAMFHSPVQLA
jgi:hypothetical protein